MWTRGLDERAAHDLVVEVADASLLPEVEALLQNLAQYMSGGDVQVKAEETLAYGYWLVKVRDGQAGRFELWEYNAAATEFVAGVSLTLKYWRDQHEATNGITGTFTVVTPKKAPSVGIGRTRCCSTGSSSPARSLRRFYTG
jgi:hypothetical protein